MTVPLERQKNIADVAPRVREQLGLGSASVEDATAFATSAQGEKADSALPAKELPITATRNGMEALEFPAGMNSLETRGYAAAGDGGGALYKKVVSEPAHAGKVQSADGAWWELVNDTGFVHIEQFAAPVGNYHDLALRSAISYLEAVGGGGIQLLAKQYYFKEAHVITRIPIVIKGLGSPWELASGTTVNHETGSQDFLTFVNCDNPQIESFRLRGIGITGGFQIRFISACRLIYMANMRISGGWNSVFYGQSFYATHLNVKWADFKGDAVITCGDGNNAGNVPQAMEFVQCQVSPSSGNNNTDLFVMNGNCASMKFTQCAFLFGRHGIVLKSTGDAVSTPRFIYFLSGGFENLQGNAFRLIEGTHAMIGPCYISTDGDQDGVYIGPNYAGPVMLTDCYIRGNGRDGVCVDNNAIARITIQGGQVANNGRTSLTVYPVQSLSVDSTTVVSVTTTGPHNLQVGDIVRISGTGTSADTDVTVSSVLSATAFQVAGVNFIAGQTAVAGSVKRLNYAINIKGASNHVIVSTCLSAFPGINRQDKTLRIGAGSTNIKVTDTAMVAGVPAQSGFINDSNSNTVQVKGNINTALDGSLELAMDAVTSGLKYFNNLPSGFMFGRRLKIIGFTCKTDTGSCAFSIYINGAPFIDSTTVNTTQNTIILAVRRVIDTLEAVAAIQVNIGALAGSPTGLRIAVHYKEED